MLKVLIVDDDVHALECLRQLIPWDQIGCTLVATAANGSEGYEQTLRHVPDIVICDIVMPMMDGTELCRQIYEKLSSVSFIFLSAYQDFATTQLALKYHVNDYILKPLNRSKLEYITHVLHQMSRRKQAEAFYLRLLHDHATEQEINTALNEGNRAFFDPIFDQLHGDIENTDLSPTLFHDVAYRLLNLLYGVIRLSGRSCDQEQKQTYAQLAQIKEKARLLELVQDAFSLYLDTQAASRDDYYHSILHSVAAYIDQHYMDPQLTAISIAEKFNYSVSYLRKRFSHAFHMSLNDYIEDKRLTQATKLLVNTNKRISDIALGVGYTSASYFTRVFRKRYDVSPLEYRAHNALTLNGGTQDEA